MARLRYRYFAFGIFFIIFLVNMELYRRLLDKSSDYSVTEQYFSADTLLDLFQEQRNQSEEFLRLIYTRNRTLIREMSSFLPKLAGLPKRCIIMSTWSTGAHLLGEILTTLPASYYHFEPLQQLGMRTISGENVVEAKEYIDVIKKLLHCRYTALKRYLLQVKANNCSESIFKANKQLRKIWFQDYTNLQNAKLLQSFCKSFPVHIMKLVRLRLVLATDLLADPNLNVKILFMIRDPRAIIHSRSRRAWLPAPDTDPKHLCQELVEDHSAAQQLQQMYPDRFFVLRFEELAVDFHAKAHEVFHFFDLPLSSEAQLNIEAHSETDIVSDARNFGVSMLASKPKWRPKLPIGNISEIQNQCGRAMHLWGYREISLSVLNSTENGD